jgi:hypothetical protein
MDAMTYAVSLDELLERGWDVEDPKQAKEIELIVLRNSQ